MECPQKRQHKDIYPNDGPETLSRPISPPRKKHRQPPILNSPWQLTWIRDLPTHQNRDAVTLNDLLGDPLVSECWEFNYLHDIDFLMNAFDPDTRHLVKVHVVHGFWKREDQNRLMLVEEASKYDNVQLHVAPMPEMFGTHHSKMMILFRHDDTAQVIVHTANMIAKDWTNMTNAVWTSQLLPKLTQQADQTEASPDQYPVGSGEKFRVDLLSYIRSYDRRKITCRPLADELIKYDFSAIRAALVASVPGIHDIHDLSQPTWGWPALKRTLRAVPCESGDSEIVVQISSIATLGAKDEWLQKTLFGSMLGPTNLNLRKPKVKVVFPTADEIRNSLDGYASGGSIHTRVQSQQQAKQLQYMRPIFHHWANDSSNGRKMADKVPKHDSGRARASPHIKTYIRYNSKSIDWALLTSANLSKQAWGEALRRATGEVRVTSWEVGVLLWPDLLQKDSIMVPTFQSDTPREKDWEGDGRPIVGLRIPYNMPLQQYGSDEIPWVATLDYSEPDRHGQRWGLGA